MFGGQGSFPGWWRGMRLGFCEITPWIKMHRLWHPSCLNGCRLNMICGVLWNYRTPWCGLINMIRNNQRAVIAWRHENCHPPGAFHAFTGGIQRERKMWVMQREQEEHHSSIQMLFKIINPENIGRWGSFLGWAFTTLRSGNLPIHSTIVDTQCERENTKSLKGVQL